MTILPIETRIALRHMAASTRRAGPKPDLRKVMKEMNLLEELDENLTDLEDAFSTSFKLASVDPEIDSQLDALEKARAGIKSAEGVLKTLQKIAEDFPEDKTVQRSLQDADVMVRRFQRHEKKAAQMLRTLSKKQMPASLKKAAASFGTAAKRLLVDPNVLQIIPWVQVNKDYRSGIKGAIYQVVFRIPDRGERAEIILSQSTLNQKGVVIGDGRGFGGEKSYDLKTAKDRFQKMLRGWDGLKGESDANAKRREVAAEIKSILEQVGGRLGDLYGRGAEISPDGLDLNISFRTDVDSRDYGQYDESYSDIAQRDYAPKFEAALKPYADFIAKQYVSNEGYKGWWDYYVTLK